MLSVLSDLTSLPACLQEMILLEFYLLFLRFLYGYNDIIMGIEATIKKSIPLVWLMIYQIDEYMRRRNVFQCYQRHKDDWCQCQRQRLEYAILLNFEPTIFIHWYGQVGHCINLLKKNEECVPVEKDIHFSAWKFSIVARIRNFIQN